MTTGLIFVDHPVSVSGTIPRWDGGPRPDGPVWRAGTDWSGLKPGDHVRLGIGDHIDAAAAAGLIPWIAVGAAREIRPGRRHWLRGYEVGGPVGEEGALTLIRAAARADGDWVCEGLGLWAMGAARAVGAAGLVLGPQLLDLDGDLDARSTRVVDGVRRLGDRPMPQSVGDATRFHGEPADILRQIRSDVDAHLALARRGDVLRGDPVNTGTPIVQGPMANVAEDAGLAAAVQESGGLPFCALGALRPEDAETVLEAFDALPGPWGAGLIGFEVMPHRDAHIALLERLRPDAVTIAGGSPRLAERLVETGLTPWLHTPTGRLARQAVSRGVPAVILEGREAGGHVGAITSAGLWEEGLRAVMPFADQQPLVVLAGGIGDPVSAAFAAALAAPAAAAGIRVALQAGTAFFFTDAIHGQITETYQKRALGADRTVLVGESANLALRCAPNAYTEEALQAEAGWADLPLKERRGRMEAMNLGRCRLAAKGITRDGNQPGVYADVAPDQQARDGAFTMGEGVAATDELTTVAALIASLTDGAQQWLLDHAPTPDPFGPVQGVPGAPRAEAAPAARPVQLGSTPEATPLAIVGLGCLVPGANDLRTFWSNLIRGVDAIDDVPPERWRLVRYWDPADQRADRTPARLAGAVAFRFDPVHFKIPPAILPTIDPAQQLALLASEQAVVDAGWTHLDRRRAAVILGNSMGGEWAKSQAVRVRFREVTGAMRSDPLFEGLDDEAFAALEDRIAASLDDTLPPLDVESMAGLLGNVVAGRVASWLDWMGGNLTVDAACAASLAALNVSADWLRSGRVDRVLSGGVDADLSPETYVGFSRTRALSRTGSTPFSVHADGFVMGEGAAIFAVRRLEDALRDGDPIWAVIRGIGQSSDGRGRGITAPRASGQALALERAWRESGRRPEDVGLIECHGTGTALGDRTEISVLREHFAAAKGPVWTGSVKSMIGHLKGAAGGAGLLKAVLSVATGVAPPTLHAAPVHPDHQLADSPLRLPRHPVRLSRRLAGVSAFGFGGTNFHVVVEGPPDGAVQPPLLSELTALAEPHLVGAEGAGWPLESTEDPGLVLLFPGQGAQRPGAFATARALDHGLDELFTEVAPHDGRFDALSLHLVLYTIGVAWARALQRAEVDIAATIGHSLGEYAALVAAGRLSAAAGLELVRARGEALAACAGGGMRAALAPAAAVRPTLPGTLVLAADNAPERCVVSGPTADLEAWAKEQSFRTVALKVPCAYHSPAVARAADPLWSALESTSFTTGRPCVSVATGTLFGADPRRDLLSGLTSPVRFREAVEVLAARGHRCFVEVGPGRTLTAFVDAMVDGQAIALDPGDDRERRRAARALSRAGWPQWHATFPQRGSADPTRQGPLTPLPPERRATRTPEPTDLRSTVLGAISEVTGYPARVLEEAGELEGDLGVDSIRKMEILGILEDRLGFRSREADYEALITIDVDGLVAYCELRLEPESSMAEDPTEDRPPVGPEPAALHLYAPWWRSAPVDVPLRVLPLPPPGRFARHEGVLMWRADVQHTMQPLERIRQVVQRWRAQAAEGRADRVVAIGAIDDPAHAAGLAFARSLAREWGVPWTTIEVDAPDTSVLVAALSGTGQQRVIRDRREEAVHLPLLPRPMPHRERGVILATGGTRGIVARCLEALPPSDLIILGRRDPDPDALDRLTQRGHHVRALICDLTDSRSVRDLDVEGADWILHGAGTLRDGPARKASHADQDAVLGPKVGGLFALRRRFPGVPVVSFGSLVAAVGNPGQTLYAAANAALELLSDTTLAFTAWSDVGMASERSLQRLLRSRGIVPLDPDDGVHAFLAALGHKDVVRIPPDSPLWTRSRPPVPSLVWCE